MYNFNKTGLCPKGVCSQVKKHISKKLGLNLLILMDFIFGCVGSSLLRRAGAPVCCGARASHCSGFSCCGAQALGARASVVVAHGLSSCGARA